MKITNKTIDECTYIVIATLILAILGIICYSLAFKLGGIAKQNQAYSRYTSCVLSVPTATIDEARISTCWEEAQKDAGKQVKRYDREF